MLLFFLTTIIYFLPWKKIPSRCQKSRANWIANFMLICFSTLLKPERITIGRSWGMFLFFKAFSKSLCCINSMLTFFVLLKSIWTKMEKWNVPLEYSGEEFIGSARTLKKWISSNATYFSRGKVKRISLSLIFARSFRLLAAFPYYYTFARSKEFLEVAVEALILNDSIIQIQIGSKAVKVLLWSNFYLLIF